MITIYHGDCLDVLPTLAPVDHVITDPPYNVSARGIGGRANTIRTRRPSGEANRYGVYTCLQLAAK